jgi:predicted Zn-dependent protease with MMP-like domain
MRADLRRGQGRFFTLRGMGYCTFRPTCHNGKAMDINEMETIARDTVAALPPPFAGLAQAVALQVVDWPSPDMLRDLDIDDPLELTGLYEGIPVTEKSYMDQPLAPDTVWLFREPILAEWRDREDVELAQLIAHVTIHEFAHHFGWSDDDIATIDRWWE